MPLSKEYILTLLKTPKIGQVSAKAINSNFGNKVNSVNELLDLIIDTKLNNSKIPIPSIEDLINANSIAKRILEECEKSGIKIVTVNDKSYPIKLFRLADHPIITYVRGSIESVNSELTAAVIGTREPSPFGIKAGKRIASILGKNGFTIVSGLAIGCDTAGHIGALEANTPTVAVLASGVNIIYPKENQYLADKIIDSGGALFSEYELNFRPQKSSFVERDRLQAGLSNGLVVVETDIKGGTMHTVGFAQKLNMPIGCISNHPDSLKDFPKINGNKFLISGGASPIGSPEQIFDFIKKMNPNADDLLNDNKSKDSSVQVDSTQSITVNEVSENVLPLFEQGGQPIDKETVRESHSLRTSSLPLESNILSQIEELKNLMLQVLTEQANTNNLIKSLLASKEKTQKKPKPNQPELL